MSEVLKAFAEFDERAMQGLELVAAFVLTVLFALGVFDLGPSPLRLVTTGRYTEPGAIIHLIDTALLLFISWRCSAPSSPPRGTRG